MSPGACCPTPGLPPGLHPGTPWTSGVHGVPRVYRVYREAGCTQGVPREAYTGVYTHQGSMGGIYRGIYPPGCLGGIYRVYNTHQGAWEAYTGWCIYPPGCLGGIYRVKRRLRTLESGNGRIFLLGQEYLSLCESTLCAGFLRSEAKKLLSAGLLRSQGGRDRMPSRAG